MKARNSTKFGGDCVSGLRFRAKFVAIFAKFGRLETKFRKKIWAPAARNSGLGQVASATANTIDHACNILASRQARQISDSFQDSNANSGLVPTVIIGHSQSARAWRAGSASDPSEPSC